MNTWIFAALIVLIVGGVVAVRRKISSRPKKLKPPTRPPVSPAPFDIEKFDSEDLTGPLQQAGIRDAIDAYMAYCTTYQRLSAGEAASDIADFSRFVTDGTSAEQDDIALERFIRTAFQSDVLYGYLALQFEQNLKVSIETGMTAQWGAGQLGEAALIAFRRTAEIRYLELYKKFFDRLMMLRDTELGYHDDYHDKIMNSWGSYNLGRNVGKPGLWIAHVTHFTVVVLPATGFARDILSNPALENHRAWATSVVNLFEEAYSQFDTDYRDVDKLAEKWYWRPLLDKYEATNHMHLQGQALLNLYAITKNDYYADRIRSFIRIFQDGVTLHGNGLASWNYSPYFQVANEKNGHISRQFSEYTWKGEITVPFLYEAKADGFDIRPDVLDGVTSSIRDHILKDSKYKLHVHPQGSRPIGPRDRKKANFIECGISGYHAAVTEDPGIEKQVVDILAASPALFPSGWVSHPRLSRSYARLLAAPAQGHS